MQRLTEFLEFSEALSQLHEAQSEQSIFTAFHAACSMIIGPFSLCGYVVSQSGSTARQVATVGSHAAFLESASDAAHWLLSDGDFPVSETPDGLAIVAAPLLSGGQLVGGVVAAGEKLREAEVLNCYRKLIQFCGAAILARNQRRLAQLVLEALEASEEAISFYDASDGILFTNDAYHKVFPHYPEPAKLIGRSHLDLYRMDLAAGIIDDPLALNDPEAYLAGRKQLSEQLVMRQREIQKIGGRTYIYTRSRSKTGATMSRRIDITDQAAAEARLRERERELHDLAFKDPLTGLFNRAYLLDLLRELQQRMSQGLMQEMAVFVIDLNGFKFINDTHGHECGDAVLKAVAERLMQVAAESDAVIRLGGDEFVIAIQRPVTQNELASMADSMIAHIGKPIRYGDLTLAAGSSIGIARRQGADATLDTIIADADLAMYEIKKTKRCAHMFFEPGMRTAALERLSLLEDIRRALRDNEFELYYQPQFNARTRSLEGFEALVRWHHPDRGMIAPGLFIPMMEEHGLIEALGEWVLRSACTEAASWPDNFNIAVNVSPLQVHGGNFALILAETLMKTGLRPDRLELEITESVFIDDEASTRVQLDLWKSLGVRIALDDFGSGYSSLNYLSSFPIDKIKIDRGFVGKLNPDDPDEAADVILRSIIDLGRALKMTVTAEGVERQDQLQFLDERHCSQVQGYLLGAPMPVQQVRRVACDTRPSPQPLAKKAI